MLAETSELVDKIMKHRLFSHPIFKHWERSAPAPEVLGAMFHQIQCFCASTRPGLKFPEGLRSLGLNRASELIEGIVASESGHGPELATMAAYVINKVAGQPVFSDLYDQMAIEARLKGFSDSIMGTLPGYDPETGLTTQARRAIGVFEKRGLSDPETTLTSLGSSMALEIVSNQHLIPGEKSSLIDSGAYGASLDDPEMHYLAEHWGECGAEQQHERYVIEAIDAVMNQENKELIFAGAFGFLDSLAALWDVIDASLLQSGNQEAPARLVAQA